MEALRQLQTKVIDLEAMCELFSSVFYAEHRTRLVGGFDEPFYVAPTAIKAGEIRFTKDYVRSALHEIAHWCVAGRERRRQDDFGYWYAPDGRSNAQQQVFYTVEVQPQAYEMYFCRCLGIPFDVSMDNLTGDVEGEDAFRASVHTRHDELSQSGFPPRVKAWGEALSLLREGVKG